MSDHGDRGDTGPDAADVGSTKRRRRRRWPWIALLLVVALVGGLRTALPTLVERGAAYGSRYWLGLPVRIDNADFDLVGGVVVLEGVSVAAAPDAVEPMDAALEPPPVDAATALLHFDRVSVHLSWDDLRNGKVRVPEFTLDAPSVRVIRESDGAIDPMRHARPLAPPVTTEPEEPASEPWEIAVDRFVLSAPNVVIVDPPTGADLLAFSLEKFQLDAISVKEDQLALGGVGIEGPVLRVRRDLVLAGPNAKEPSPATAGSPAAQNAASPTPAAPASAPETVENAATSTPDAAGSAPAVPPAAAPAVAPSTAPSAAPAAAPPGYRIDKIDIARAKFTWVTDRGPLDVTLALKATDITADEGKRFPLDLQLQIADGRIAIAGDVGILPPSYTGKLTWSGLPFPPLLLASLPDMAAWLRTADSTGDLALDVDVAGVRGPPSLRMSGRTAISTLAISDPGDKEFALGFRQLEVVMKEVVVPLPEAGKPARTTLANLELVRLDEPKIRYRHPSPALNALLGIPAAAPAADPKSADAAKAAARPNVVAPSDAKATTATAASKTAAPPQQVTVAANPDASNPDAANPDAAPPVVDVTIASLELAAGDLEVIDTTVTPEVASSARELFVSARDVHFPDPSARAIKLRAVLPKASALTVEGELRPGNNGDFTLSLQKLDLPMFSPYATAAGASLDSGQASVKTKLKMRGQSMQVDNELVLRKFGVSLRDPSSFDRNFGMPIDLALALLRDPAGDIKLSIPVRIDEKGAQVSTGAIIASALKAALLGAVTAPLKLLGAAFGGGEGAGEGGAPSLAIAPIRAVAGSAQLADDAASRADGLAKLLGQRPAMGLTLRGRSGAEDRPLVAEQMLVERLKAGDGLPELKDSGFLARRRISQALLARDKNASAKEGKTKSAPEALSGEDQALFDRYLAAVEIPSARLDALARARAEKVRELLATKGVDAKRVSVGDRETDGEPAVVIGLRPA